ncbi:MAG TPA: diacylglycerol kinase family protein [Verrucomicrobiae bacterium]|nr:diacylglycerol kinase family protein [Verrucomicrobiae bacterium]
MKPLLASFRYAFRGLFQVCKTERNMKIHLAAAVLALALSGFFHVSRQEFLMICLAITLVMTAEAFNTALEKVVDLVSPDYHPLAGQAKDIAAGAVLITAIFSVVVGLFIFIPRLFP